MALTVDQTKEIIRGAKNADPVISDIKFANEGGSQVGTANAWAYLHALASNLLSQLFDKFQSDVTTIVQNNVAGNPFWVKSKILEFQTGHQAEIDGTTFITSYPTVDLDAKIITQCSVKTALNGQVNIKVAKGGASPEKLTTIELDELKSYYELINPSGILFEVISNAPDRLFVEATIYYNGQYVSVISDTTIAAINAYLSSLPFDGNMVLSDLEATIRAVEGVTDVVFENVYARSSVTVFASATKMIENYKLTTLSNRKWETVAGYMISEDTSGSTLADSLTFTIDG
jgi:hypothetical protein